jgi:AcrR family transcriptional regulator
MSTVAPPAAPLLRARSDRVDEIVAAARAALVADGGDAVTMRRVAADLGIRAPSLYKHLDGKAAIEVLLAEDALVEIGTALHASVAKPGRREPVAAVAATYRAYGRAHPNLYRLVTGATFPRRDLSPGLEEWAGSPFLLATGDPYRGQALWAWAHGMVSLEIDARFLPGSDLDHTWAEGVRAFARA